jgi:hypothetical protein
LTGLIIIMTFFSGNTCSTKTEYIFENVLIRPLWGTTIIFINTDLPKIAQRRGFFPKIYSGDAFQLLQLLHVPSNVTYYDTHYDYYFHGPPMTVTHYDFLYPWNLNPRAASMPGAMSW